MTQKEYDDLKPGDIVRNVINKTIKVVMTTGFPIDPIVSTSPGAILRHLKDWEVYMKARPKE